MPQTTLLRRGLLSFHGQYLGVFPDFRLTCPNSYLVSFDHVVALLLHDRALAPQSELAVVQHQRRVVNYAAFEEMMTDGRVNLLVARRKPTQFLGVDFSAASLVAVVDGWQIFRPSTSHCR